MRRLIAILAISLAGGLCLPAGAQAAFGIDSFDAAFSSADGSPATHAGSHPYAFTFSLGTNSDGTEPEGRLRELFLDLPPGLVASTTSIPRCAEADFETLDEGVNDCSDVTALGVVSTAVGEAGNWSTAPVFNLAPLPGELMRLGFRVAGVENVFVDVWLSPEPPYEALLSVGDFPEAIELFGVKLQLWGVPASPMHDQLRGWCAVHGEGASCPAGVAQRPLLTLPTSCEGPQQTSYEVLSWEGDEESGAAFTQDGAGNPLGFHGCGALSFQPQAFAPLTTSEANRPTGLDLSLAFYDEGLANSGGFAESQVREVAIFLPDGMAAGQALADAAGACSEGDFEEEVLEAAPGEGCPETSKVGTVEVESTLLEGPVEGVVYRAVPFANLAEGSPMALYLVLRSTGRGILVKQVVGLETDPETGRLIAFAEEIPQLPISHLQLHLAEAGGTLISPPRCGDYEAMVGLVPWANDLLVTVSSSFEIVSGPNGGPCPEEGGNPGAEGESQNSSVSASAAASSGTLGSGGSGDRKRSCPKGKRRVRRNGKVRCVKHRHKKSKAVRRGRGGHER